MSVSGHSPGRRAKAIVLAGLAVVFALTGFADAGTTREGRAAGPVVKIERDGTCVAPTDEMRRDHMKMLFHQRDRTMHEGVREKRFSLKACIECHADSRTGSVLGPEGFCSSCHAYASVRIDCFECHTPLRPASGAEKRR